MDTSEAALKNILSLPTELHCHIFSYLSINDLLELRLTCNHFNDAIMVSQEFKKRLKISLNAKNLPEIAESIQRNEFRLSSCNVEFKEVSDCPEVTYVMGAIANGVRQLILYEATIYEALASVEMPNLQTLKVLNPIGKLNKTLSGWNFTSYRNLKSLDISSGDVDFSLHDYILEQVVKLENVKFESLSVACTNVPLVTDILKHNANSLINLNIDFYRFPILHDQKSWTEAFESMIALKTLQISGSYVKDFWIYKILTALPETVQLTGISITYTDGMTDRLLGFIAKKYQYTLQAVNFSNCLRLTSRGFNELRQHARNLRKIKFSLNSITFDSFVFKKNVALQELSLPWCMITDGWISELARNLPDLVLLNLSYCNVKDKDLAYIFRYQTRLQTLNLNHCSEITDRGLMGFGERNWPIPMPITRLKALKSLDLNGVKKLTDNSFTFVFKFKQLRDLCVGHCDEFTNEGIAYLPQNCPALENLCLYQDDWTSQLTVDVLDIIANNFKRLRTFFISGENIKEEVRTNFFKKYPSIKKTQSYMLLDYI